MGTEILDEAFFARDTPSVARDLIGCEIRVDQPEGLLTGRIVETEAYGGQDDPASHAGRGRTPRSAVMFGPPAVVYVYFIYGVHHCLNFVTEPEGRAGAVLLRAVEPLQGRREMARRRGLNPDTCSDRDLTRGPGRLCAALGLDRGWTGVPLTGPQSRIRIAGRKGKLGSIISGPRVGISRAQEKPWRFCLAGSSCLTV